MIDFSKKLQKLISEIEYSNEHAAKLLRTDISMLENWLSSYNLPHYLMQIGAIEKLTNQRNAMRKAGKCQNFVNLTNSTKWKDDEIIFLKGNYKILGRVECARQLGRTVAAVTMCAAKIGASHKHRNKLNNA